MQTGRSDANDHVSGFDRSAVMRFLFRPTRPKTGQNRNAGGIKIGQNSSLAPQQGASRIEYTPMLIPSTIWLEQGRVVLGHGHVIERKQRSARSTGIVHAHGHQVDAHGVVSTSEMAISASCPPRRAGNEHGRLINFGRKADMPKSSWNRPENPPSRGMKRGGCTSGIKVAGSRAIAWRYTSKSRRRPYSCLAILLTY